MNEEETVLTESKKEEILKKVHKGDISIEEFEEEYNTETLSKLEEEGLVHFSDDKVEISTKAKMLYSISEIEKSEMPFFTDGDSPKFVPLSMAETLMEDYNFATHEESEELYLYEDGIYKPKGKAVVKREAQRRLGEYVKTHYINETLEAVKRGNYVSPERFNNPEDGIVVDNGMLDVKNRELKEHSPDYIHLVKIPWKYDPEADCPKIKKFIGEVVNEDDIKLVQEMFGYCLLKDYPFAKAFMLLGSGANGKSTLLQLLEEFLGEDNIATPSLQDLLQDKFAKIELFGKLANIHADLSSEKLENTGTFKMLTGGDTIYGQKKFQDPIKFKNIAKLIYSANELPKTDDRTEAFFRRWIVIDFPNQFPEDSEGTDPKLPYSIIDEEEMSGLLNWALDGLERIEEQGGFSRTDSRKEIEQEWIMKTDSLRAFLDIACETKKDGYVAKKDFYEVYTKFCDENNLYSVKKGQVTKRLPTLEPKVKLYRPEIDGKQVRCWKNLEIKESFLRGELSNISNHNYIQDIQPMRTSSIARAHVTNNKGSQKRLDMSDINNLSVTKEEILEFFNENPKAEAYELSEEFDIEYDEAVEIIDKLVHEGELADLGNKGYKVV